MMEKHTIQGSIFTGRLSCRKLSKSSTPEENKKPLGSMGMGYQTPNPLLFFHFLSNPNLIYICIYIYIYTSCQIQTLYIYIYIYFCVGKSLVKGFLM